MLRFYKNYQYDSTYDYIKMFNSKSEQSTYFNNLDYDEVEKDYYIRGNTNSFVLDMSYEEIESKGYNYLSYDNEGKTYYCFLNTIEYSSEYRTRIIFQIDVIQSFMFDFSLGNSFIERKVCSLSELTTYDEGLDTGEHEVVSDTVLLEKDSTFFAMFNGIKEQSIVFNDKGKVENVIDLPFVTSKPLTSIDGINYPLYFMPLKETYKDPTKEYIDTPTLGETSGGDMSAKIFRFIKGYEGFAQYPNYFNGESFRTGGYGITENYQAFYFNLLGTSPYNEEKASEVLYTMMKNEFSSSVYQRMLRDGLKADQIKQRHFDAFISLAMNGGLGAVTTSPMYAKYLNNQEDNTIYDDWLTWYIRNENGEVMDGLVARRQEEANIFRDGNYKYRTISLFGSMGTIVGSVTDNNGHGFIPSSLKGEV